MMFTFPEQEESIIFCEYCGSELPNQPLSSIRVRMSLTPIKTFSACDSCATERFGIEKEKLEFVRSLILFKKENKITSKDLEKFPKKAVEVFLRYLKSKNLPIRNYDVMICRQWFRYPKQDVEYDLLDLVKHYKIKLENKK